MARCSSSPVITSVFSDLVWEEHLGIGQARAAENSIPLDLVVTLGNRNSPMERVLLEH